MYVDPFCTLNSCCDRAKASTMSDELSYLINRWIDLLTKSYNEQGALIEAEILASRYPLSVFARFEGFTLPHWVLKSSECPSSELFIYFLKKVKEIQTKIGTEIQLPKDFDEKFLEYDYFVKKYKVCNESLWDIAMKMADKPSKSDKPGKSAQYRRIADFLRSENSSSE